MPVYCRVTPQLAHTDPEVIADDEHNTVCLAPDEDDDSLQPSQSLSLAKSRASFHAPPGKSPARLRSLVTGSGGHYDGKQPIKLRGVYPPAMDDKTSIQNLARDLIPSISARENVTLLLHGHEKTGKTCLMEQLLMTVMEGLKVAISSAEEAHQENLSLEGTQPTSMQGQGGDAGGRRLVGGAGGNAAAADAALGAIHRAASADASAHPGGDGRSRKDRAQTAGTRRRKTASVFATSPLRPGTAAGASPTRDKYALLFSRFGPEANSLTMDEVRTMRPASAKPLLPKIEPATVHSFGLSSASPASQDPNKEHRESLLKVQFERSRSPIRMLTGLTTNLGQKNGRGGAEHDTLRLNGDDVFLIAPHIPKTDLALKSNNGLRIAMWICTTEEGSRRKMGLFHFTDELDPNFTLRMCLNTNASETYEQGVSLMTLRDYHGKTLELLFSDNLCDGKWHRLQVDFVPVENTIVLKVDGRKARPRVLRVESPEAIYEDRAKVCRFGTILMPNPEGHLEPANHFGGYICDIMFSTGAGEMLAHYPLAPQQQGPLVGFCEKRLNYDPIQVKPEMDEEKRNALFEPFAFPTTAPNFDGKNNFVNVGTLGDFGIHLHAFTVEFSVRTACTTEQMTVLGVADAQGRCPTRHPGFSIDLNTSPTGSTQRCALSVTVTDYYGNTLCTVADVPELFDDRWHHVSMKLVDANLGRFKFRVDGRPADVVNAHTQTSSSFSFINFTQFLAIGCHNNRGKLCRHLKGSLHHVSISRMVDDIDETIGSWPMEEGPGSLLAMDTTGHGFTGVYSVSKGVRGSTWYPVDGAISAQAGSAEELNMASLAEGVNVVRHNNNIVSMAFVGLRPTINQHGNASEQIVDFIGGETYDQLDTIPLKHTNSRAARGDVRTLQWIPSPCFKVVTPSDYMRVFANALAQSQDFGHRAHILFVLRLGDAIFAAFDLASYSKSSRARFNSAQLAWTDAISTFGVSNKMNRMLNHDLGKLDKELLRCGNSPQMYKRSVFLRQNAPSHSDSFLASLVMFSLLSGSEFSRLFHVLLMAPFTTKMEALHLLSIVKETQQIDLQHAAMIVQKNYRFRMGRRIYFGKIQAFDEAEARKDHAGLMRRNYPSETKAKSNRKALIVFATEFEKDKALSSVPHGFDDRTSVYHLLDQLGYKCMNLTNPNKEFFFKALESIRTPDTQILVYFVGYGLRQSYSVPPSYAQAREWVEMVEARSRAALNASYDAERRELRSQADSGKKEVLELLERIAAEEAAKAAKGRKKKKGSIAPPPPKPKPKEDPKAKAAPADSKGKGAKGEKAPAGAKGKGPKAPKGDGPKPDPAAVAEKADATADAAAAEQAAADAAAAAAAEEVEVEAPIVEPTYDTTEHTYFLLGDSTSHFRKETSLTLNELRSAVVGDLPPKRGNHAIFMYDCLSFQESAELDDHAADEGHGLPASKKKKNTLSGFGGLVGSSGESLHLEYHPHQRFLMSYYLKRILNGCAVEAVKIGKHEPPQMTTIETAFRYLQNKMGKEGRFATPVWDCKWFGEYVGDVYIADKLLHRKEERQKMKKTNAHKKSLTQSIVRFSGEWQNDFKAPILSTLAEVCHAAMLDVRRVAVGDTVSVNLSGDRNIALYHPSVTSEIETAVAGWFPEATKAGTLEWWLTVNPLQLHIRPVATHPVFTGALEKPDDKRDAKQRATDFSIHFDNRAELIDFHVLGGLHRIYSALVAAAKIAYPNAGTIPTEESSPLVASATAAVAPSPSTAVFAAAPSQQHEESLIGDAPPPTTVPIPLGQFFHVCSVEVDITIHSMNNEEETAKLDRAARVGLYIVDGAARLLSARHVGDKEAQVFTHEETMLAMEEQRKIAEAKAATYREAEARRKLEEEKRELEAQQPAAIDRIDELRIATVITPANIDECFRLPLSEVYIAAIECLTSATNRGLGKMIVDNGALKKIRTVVLPSEFARTHDKLVSSIFKLISALAADAVTKSQAQEAFPEVLRCAVKNHAKVHLLWTNIRAAVTALGAVAWEPVNAGDMLLSSLLPEMELASDEGLTLLIERCTQVPDLVAWAAATTVVSTQKQLLARVQTLLSEHLAKGEEEVPHAVDPSLTASDLAHSRPNLSAIQSLIKMHSEECEKESPLADQMFEVLVASLDAHPWLTVDLTEETCTNALLSVLDVIRSYGTEILKSTVDIRKLHHAVARWQSVITHGVAVAAGLAVPQKTVAFPAEGEPATQEQLPADHPVSVCFDELLKALHAKM